MTEKIEQIMKRIHVLFTKCTPLDQTPDKVIVPKRQLFVLLEELNIAINDIMEQYEVTERSRERGKRKFEEKGQRIIDNATKSAEDIYAASMLYTDRMLIDLRSVVEQASHDLKKEYDFLAGQIESQIAMIEENQGEVREQLKGLSQSEKYIDIINQYNDRIMERRRAALQETEVALEKQEPNNPVDEINIDEIEDFLISSIAEVLGDLDVELPESEKKEVIQKIDVKKESKSSQGQSKKKEPKKIASVVDEGVFLGAQEDTVKRVSYEIKVNPWYGGEAGSFNSADLDAEYEQWKSTEESVASAEEITVKEKNKRKGQPRKKKR